MWNGSRLWTTRGRNLRSSTDITIIVRIVHGRKDLDCPKSPVSFVTENGCSSIQPSNSHWDSYSKREHFMRLFMKHRSVNRLLLRLLNSRLLKVNFVAKSNLLNSTFVASSTY